MTALDLIKTLKKDGIRDIIVDDFKYEVEPIISVTSEVVEWRIESDLSNVDGEIYNDLIIRTTDYEKHLKAFENIKSI